MSHTTDDLIFEWYPEEDTPLVVEPIQLPQVSRDWWTAGDPVLTRAYNEGYPKVREDFTITDHI